MSGIDWRALCAELLADYEVHLYRSVLADRARTALAQPEPEAVGLSPEEVEDLCEGHCFNVEGYESIECLQGLINDALARYAHQPAPAAETDAILALAAIIREVDGNHSLGAAALAEAILSHRDSRWGQQPAPPAEGEVAELVAALRSQAIDCTCDHLTSGDLRRAADLLEHQAAPVLEPALARINDILNDSGRILQTDELEALELARQALEQRHPAPVPVSERLPGPEDCDAEGRCWLHLPDMGTEPLWRLTDPSMRSRYHSHWLPSTALPLPQGEVQP